MGIGTARDGGSRARIALSLALISTLFMGGCATPASRVSSSSKLGTAVQGALLEQNEAYRTQVLAHFGSITPEYELKMDQIAPQPGRYDFSQIDKIAYFAAKNGLKMRGHTLVWHRSLPAWIHDPSLTKEELAQILKTHIQTVMNHFRDKFPGLISEWDVVNEALDDEGNLREKTPWAKIGKSPSDYIALSFKWAREADPQARLFYNDYGNHDLGPKTKRTLEFVSRELKNGTPIHGIGLQMHLEPKYPLKSYDFGWALSRYSALGLEIQITELDVRVPISGIQTSKALEEQAQEYRKVALGCRDYSACTKITTWGFSDAHTWIGSEPGTEGFGMPLPFDREYKPKPGFYALSLY